MNSTQKVRRRLRVDEMKINVVERGEKIGTKRTAIDGTSNSPKYENEQNQQREEYRDVVHRPEHDEQLPPEVGHKANQFEDSQQSERSQHREPGVAAAAAFASHARLTQLNGTEAKR